MGALVAAANTKNFYSGIKNRSWKDIADPMGVGTRVKKMMGLQEQDVPPPPPLPDEEALTRARRRRLAGVVGRTGRDSTIMSDALGGP